MNYNHLFFDLDHTLWDFETNAHECLEEIYFSYRLESLGVDNTQSFLDTFSEVNRQYWAMLENNDISAEELKRQRFKVTLQRLGVEIDFDFGLKMTDTFLALLPHKKALIEGTIEILEYLKPKYNLHIISNGWYDIQIKKMESSAIHHYFDEIITHEKVNALKPNKAIFDYAVLATNTETEQCLMIGDNYEADVLGAMNAGIDAVFYNPDQLDFDSKPTFEIRDLRELMELL
jgi:YjjG family noncanonical pyrimidine nucleotidase